MQMEGRSDRTDLNIRVRTGTQYTNAVIYVLKVIERNQELAFSINKKGAHDDITFDHTDPKSESVATEFYARLREDVQSLGHSEVFKTDPIIKTPSGQDDLIATIFYMLNCVQEYAASEEDLDRYGRFKYSSSYQYRFDVVEENLVQKHMDVLLDKWGLQRRTVKSAFFISHDVDALYGSLIHDGLWAIRHGRIDILFKIVLNEILRKPEWRNIDRIMDLNDEYGIKSTFFWIVRRGRDQLGIKNGDYYFMNERGLVERAERRGFVNGLHKSTLETTIDEELEDANFQTTLNRYHYLKFLPVQDWSKIESSRITFDASLGFAERYGFRNSYGSAFQPYNIEEDRPYSFVVAPLHMMDGTFTTYMGLPVNRIADKVIAFYERNAEHCIISLLWHNTSFTPHIFRGMREEYLKIAGYIVENEIECQTPMEIEPQVALKW